MFFIGYEIYKHFLGFVFTLLTVSFEEQKFLTFIKSNLSFFFFCGSFFDVVPKKSWETDPAGSPPRFPCQLTLVGTAIPNGRRGGSKSKANVSFQLCLWWISNSDFVFSSFYTGLTWFQLPLYFSLWTLSLSLFPFYIQVLAIVVTSCYCYPLGCFTFPYWCLGSSTTCENNSLN